MSQYMQQPPQQPGPMTTPPRPGNTLGLVAFILSIVGLVGAVGVLCCPPLGILGLLGLVGAVMGFVAMRKEPRGLAIAGAAMGVIATIVSVVMIAVFGAIIGLGVSLEAKRVATIASIREAESLIEQDILIGGTAPDDTEGRAVISAITDGWDRPLRYRREVGGDYQIISAGMDGQFGTVDDIDRTTPGRR